MASAALEQAAPQPVTWVDAVLGADVDYITYAVPLFVILILVELVCATVAGRQLFRLNDSLTDLACGMIEQLLGVFLKTALFAGYVLVYRHFRLLEIQHWSPGMKWVAAGVLFLGVDCCFYWFHRFAHVMAFPWATHVVHHSSEELNLIVALRQSALEDAIAWVFYLPLALLGFPPLWFAAMFSFNLIWQFWCHTRLVGKLGPLEWVFNTPSHHRVHHARNPQYLDKNYAGALIIWDRLFGTFEEEREEPVYGITKPLASWNPYWANVHYWVELARQSRRAPYCWDKWKVWVMPLGWTPRGLEPERHACEITPQRVLKYNARLPGVWNAYVFGHFLLTMGLGSALMHLAERRVSLWQLAPGSAALFLNLLVFGGLLERRRWAWWLELARLGLVTAGSCWVAQGTRGELPLSAAAVLLALASLVWLVRGRSLFQNAAWVQVAPAGIKSPAETRVSGSVPIS